MSAIFINYRRQDAQFVVDRVYAWLARAFGRRRLFRDVDQIRPAANFQAAIDDALQQSRVVLVFIGEQWLTVTSSDGTRRIDEPGDYVRREIETAIEREIPLLPVFLQGTQPPAAEQLPASIGQLGRTNGVMLRPEPEFADSIRRLTRHLAEILGTTPRLIVGDAVAHPTSPQDLHRWIQNHATHVQGEIPYWRFRFSGREAFCQCQQADDDSIDRMRIVAPIAHVAEWDRHGIESCALFERMLEANYHSALDPRYSIEDGIVMAAFLHPLSTLTEGQFYAALQQVTEMVWTFGTSFSSSEIIYGGVR